jgi:hypothetical protein
MEFCLESFFPSGQEMISVYADFVGDMFYFQFLANIFISYIIW